MSEDFESMGDLVAAVDAAQSELLDLIYRAVSSAGGGFAPRLPGASAPDEDGKLAAPERLLAGVSLFAEHVAPKLAGLVPARDPDMVAA